jgi:tRNA(adenine34) deaminase
MATRPLPSPADLELLDRAAALALVAEARGNLPIAAVLALAGEVVAEGVNETVRPQAHPGRHAEVLALAGVPPHLVGRLPEMTCYTTLEPCLMCFGSLVLHGIGRVVFGARDPLGGALGLLPHLPPYVGRKAAAIEWVGPAGGEACRALWERAARTYRGRLPEGG